MASMRDLAERSAARGRAAYKANPNAETALEMVMRAAPAYGMTSDEYRSAVKEALTHMEIADLAEKLGKSASEIKAALL